MRDDTGKTTRQAAELAAEVRGIIDELEAAEARGWALAERCAAATLERGQQPGRGKAGDRVSAAEFAELVGRPRFGEYAVALAARTWRRFGAERLRWSDGRELTYGDHNTAANIGADALAELVRTAEARGLALTTARWAEGVEDRQQVADHEPPGELETARRVMAHPERAEQVLADPAAAAGTEAAQVRLEQDATARRFGIDADRGRERARERERDEAAGRLEAHEVWRGIARALSGALARLRFAAGELGSDRVAELNREDREALGLYLERIGEFVSMAQAANAAGEALTDEALGEWLAGLEGLEPSDGGGV